ncbi:MAG: hypothetical protein PHG32_06185, partial [Candidatus Cloacimonetes bacterium]|nr:hypothetical protein [Candidatus Cloacimonadota bacterium]
SERILPTGHFLSRKNLFPQTKRRQPSGMGSGPGSHFRKCPGRKGLTNTPPAVSGPVSPIYGKT